jgi:dolichol-phosphate mannosyltransferase
MAAWDNTSNLLEEYSKKMPIKPVNHSINRGLGETERDGFEYIATHCNSEDIIIRMDCDDTHEPMYMPDHVQKNVGRIRCSCVFSLSKRWGATRCKSI